MEYEVISASEDIYGLGKRFLTLKNKATGETVRVIELNPEVSVGDVIETAERITDCNSSPGI